ncbi:trans-aconitate 2-methyltransferase [Chitinophaga sp.]|uniref:class I SAM-dependent methyltransferase n=1 Tax=Chitinophaga sp. TaxID=1869181 RepID=UPI0026226547|nr:class I SAM-dependent methyltransferase [uncultured Chitinophaga sp.]
MTAREAALLIHLPQPATRQPQTWADLGSGSGLFSEALLRQLPPQSQVYAIDRSTIPQPAPGIIPLQRDFLDFPWSLPPLHGILMANALHFVEQQETFLQQAVRYILPGGQFLFVEYDTDTPNPWVPYPLSLSTLQSRFRHLGLLPPQLLRTMPSKFGRARLYAAVTAVG